MIAHQMYVQNIFNQGFETEVKILEPVVVTFITFFGEEDKKVTFDNLTDQIIHANKPHEFSISMQMINKNYSWNSLFVAIANLSKDVDF